MKKYIFILVISIIFMGITACPDKADTSIALSTINRSNEDILLFAGWVNEDFSCLDTLIPYKKMGIELEKGVGKVTYCEPPNCTIRVFIFNLDTIKKYDWDIIRSERKYIKQYNITPDELKKMDWTITYP